MHPLEWQKPQSLTIVKMMRYLGLLVLALMAEVQAGTILETVILHPIQINTRGSMTSDSWDSREMKTQGTKRHL